MATLFGIFGKILLPDAHSNLIVAFLFIEPVQAFIPGLIVSFITFFIVNAFVLRKLPTTPQAVQALNILSNNTSAQIKK